MNMRHAAQIRHRQAILTRRANRRMAIALTGFCVFATLLIWSLL